MDSRSRREEGLQSGFAEIDVLGELRGAIRPTHNLGQVRYWEELYRRDMPGTMTVSLLNQAALWSFNGTISR